MTLNAVVDNVIILKLPTVTFQASTGHLSFFKWLQPHH